jgi:hypothetical protein
MKNRNRSDRRAFWIFLAAMGPAAFAFGQSQSQTSQSSQPSQQSSSPTQAQPQQKEDSAADAAKKAQKDKPKPKKVYTEEDLSSMHGNGVSVVGGEIPAGSGAAGTKQADGKTKAGVVPMSGQDEGYWRGRARGILDAIAATDQEIARTKEEIKKYGSDGFDATTGLKDNIIYIDNRSSKVQQLEKRKADLEKKLDQLQEEGRKAGADASWFR